MVQLESLPADALEFPRSRSDADRILHIITGLFSSLVTDINGSTVQGGNQIGDSRDVTVAGETIASERFLTLISYELKYCRS